MKKDNRKSILQYESNFQYADGIIRTPKRWITYFWNCYYTKITPIISTKIQKYDKVVFVGVGGGDIVPLLKDEEKRKIIGVDINASSLVSAAEHVEVVLSDASNMPFKSDTFYLIVCNQVLHHIIGQGSLEDTLKECYRILKKGGEFIAIEPNSFHPSGAMMNIANRFHKYHLLTGGSDYEFSPSPFYLKKILKSCNFKGVKSTAITFSHPRFPIFLQKAITMIENKLSMLYLLGLINTYTAVK